MVQRDSYKDLLFFKNSVKDCKNKILFFEYLLANKPNDNYIFLINDLAVENLVYKRY